MAFFFTTEEFTNGKEKTLFALLPLHYSDIVFAKLLIITKKILLIAFSVSLPFITMYGEKVFALLKPVLFADKFAVLIIAYIILLPSYVVAISIIAVTLSFIFVIASKLVSSISDYLKFSKSLVWLNLIIAGVFGVFSFTIWNAALTFSSSYLVRIYGYPPVFYISKAIVDIIRPVPNVLYSVKVVFWLIITVFIFLLVVFGVSVIAGKKYWACPQSSFKEIKQSSGNAESKEFKIFENLPIFIKKDTYAFLRKGNAFKWLLNSFALAVIIPLIFYTPAMLSKEISAKLTYTIFGVKINYLALLILIISLAQFSQVAFYVFYSDENDVFLLKVTPVNVRKFLLEKFFAAAIIVAVPLTAIVAAIFLFFAHAQRPYYMYMAITQFFILFFWDFTSSFYVGGIGTKVISRKVTFWQLENGRLSMYLMVLSLISLLIWSIIYKFVLKVPNILAISIVATEIILPILILGKIIKRIENTIKKIDLCSLD